MRAALLMVLVAGACASALPFSPEAGRKNWVLIVAGSSSWDNYRHQADVCHAYQVVHKHGLPDSQIVVMMFDDLANNSANPTPGKIINRPNGPDVYKGVPKDYVGKDVTPENFLAVLRGERDAVNGIGSGKVLQSGPDDHIFVFFTDHGAPGILGFPDQELHVEDLNKTIQDMHDNKQFAKMVFYIEACESGSMMINLASDVNVYATTAAGTNEPSYACYYDDDRETYLGDVYSVKWMEDSDSEDLYKETIHKQFKIVKEETNTSHVQQYGDKTISHMKLVEFQGDLEAVPPPPLVLPPASVKDAVPSPDVPLAILEHRLNAARDPEVASRIFADIQTLLQTRKRMEEVVRGIVGLCAATPEQAQHLLELRQDLNEHGCYRTAVTHFKSRCFNWSDQKYQYALRHLYVLLNMCEEKIPIGRIEEAMDKMCLAL
ncbi:legumain [Lampetra fluviatilis]